MKKSIRRRRARKQMRDERGRFTTPQKELGRLLLVVLALGAAILGVVNAAA